MNIENNDAKWKEVTKDLTYMKYPEGKNLQRQKLNNGCLDLRIRI